MKKLRKTLVFLPFLALAQPQVAHAQQCISGAEAAALFVYAMPPAIEAVRNTCEGRLKSNGFLTTGGAKLSARYAALQTESWPQAKRAAVTLLSSNTPNTMRTSMGSIDPARMFQTLPDNLARPLADTLILQKVAEQVRPEQCGEIEQVFSAMSPIAPRDAGALLGAVANLVGLENLDVCKVD